MNPGTDTEGADEPCERTENKGDTPVGSDDSDDRMNALNLPDADQDQTATLLKQFEKVIEAIDFDALRRLAVQTRLRQLLGRGSLKHGWSKKSQKSKKKLTCTIDETAAFGSYNIVYKLTFSDGTKWVVRIPGHGCFLDEDEIEKMNYEYQAMRYARNNTTISIPEVFIWDTECDLIGVAFALMSWSEGRSVCSLWFDKEWSTDEKRLRILTSVANNMAQLQKLRTDRIGAPRFTDDGQLSHVGPELYFRGNRNRAWAYCSQRGPWKTFREYLDEIASERNHWDAQVLMHAFESIPPDLADPSTCCLSLHDFNYQNILVDEKGNVTAVIDWDRVQSLPASAGPARFPAWITPDWDPACYDYQGDHKFMDSPQDLLRYRKHYAAAFDKASIGIEGYSPRQVELSFLVEGVVMSAGSEFLRQYIMKKFLQYAFDDKVPFTIPEYGAACDEGTEEERYGQQIREAFARNLWRREKTVHYYVRR